MTIAYLITFIVLGVIGGILTAKYMNLRVWNENHRLHRLTARQLRTIDDIEYHRDDAHGIMFYLYQAHANEMSDIWRPEVERILRDFVGLDDDELAQMRGGEAAPRPLCSVCGHPAQPSLTINLLPVCTNCVRTGAAFNKEEA